MAITTADFKAGYPEFFDAPDSLVAVKLAEAQQLVPSSIWNAGGDPTRDLTQQAVFLYTAQFLSESPYARKMNLVDDKGGSPYKARLDTLRRIVSSGNRVL